MNPLPYTTARSYAIHLRDLLAPHCVRVEIAGSIRRQRPYVNDVDLVVIPKGSITTTNLFGEPEATAMGSPLHAFLVRFVQESAAKQGRASVWISGEKNPSAVNYILKLPKVQLDVFVATELNWGSKLLQRTGSKEHNIWIASRARQLGLEWKLDTGIIRPDGAVVASKTEREIYAALGMHYVIPENREDHPGHLRAFVINQPVATV